MVIFGGRTLEITDGDGTGRLEEICLNDTHILDLKTLRWIPSNLNGATLRAISHSSSLGATPTGDFSQVSFFLDSCRMMTKGMPR